VKSRKFVDSVILYAFGGRGGNGCVSFRREKYIPRGGPDGGDGGKGGDVILKANREVDSLIQLYFTPHQRAESGEHGKGKQLYGRGGRDRIVPIPRGTEIWDAQHGELLADIVKDGQEFVVAKGGKGGKGNMHWKTATHQAPMEHTPGEEGEEAVLRLELKLIADAGLVGLPNAGKSSLLTVLSDAHPKIGAYPFTTLNPIIGTLVFDNFVRLTVADLPGLIKGASEGAGLGDAFLRHVERAPLLLYVIDMAGVDMRDPCQDYLDLRQEIEQYRENLLDRPSLIVANKMDVPEAENNLKEFRKRTRKRPIPVSALTGEGLDKLRDAIHKLWKKARPKELGLGS
jgi:GTP-binding protein